MFKEQRIEQFIDYVQQYQEAHKLSNESTIPYTLLSWLEHNGFFEMPASTKYHLNYEGGLFEHSLNVAKTLDSLTVNNQLTWGRPESPLYVGMFHDLCKHDAYARTVSGWEYNKDMLLTGHGEKSIILLAQFINLTEEEILCIRYHMGAFETDVWDQYNKAIKKYPNVLWTHQADMIASKILES